MLVQRLAVWAIGAAANVVKLEIRVEGYHHNPVNWLEPRCG
jgi:hypothetical protein